MYINCRLIRIRAKVRSDGDDAFCNGKISRNNNKKNRTNQNKQAPIRIYDIFMIRNIFYTINTLPIQFDFRMLFCARLHFCREISRNISLVDIIFLLTFSFSLIYFRGKNLKLNITPLNFLQRI